MTIPVMKRSSPRPIVASPQPAAKGKSRWLVLSSTAAVVLVVAAFAVVHLAYQRGDEIARERADRAAQVASVRLVQAFVNSKSVLVMKDGSRRELVGAAATLLSTKPIDGKKPTWLVLGRVGSSGVHFGQRFLANEKGEVVPVTDAQEISEEVALGELRAQISAGGVSAEATRAFVQAATTGKAVPVSR